MRLQMHILKVFVQDDSRLLDRGIFQFALKMFSEVYPDMQYKIIKMECEYEDFIEDDDCLSEEDLSAMVFDYTHLNKYLATIFQIIDAVVYCYEGEVLSSNPIAIVASVDTTYVKISSLNLPLLLQIAERYPKSKLIVEE